MAAEVVLEDDYRLHIIPVEDEQDTDNELKSELYKAVSREENDRVKQLCSETTDGPLYKIDLQNATVLNLACFIKNFKLANELLDKVIKDTSSSEEELYHKLVTSKHSWGNTILHDAVTSNKGIPFAKKVLDKVPRLLEERNLWGESPLLMAIRYGRKHMYQYLECEVRNVLQINDNHDWQKHLHFFQRDDKMTALHLAILTRQFYVALDIAKKYPKLYDVQDNRQMNPLQMLASSPTAFESGTKLGPLQKLIYKFVSTNDQDTNTEVGMTRKAINSIIGCVFPMIEEVRNLKRDNKDALKLAKMLVKKDFSWKKTFIPRKDNMGENKRPLENETPYHRRVGEGVGEGDDEVPLHLAAKKGCVEIVKEILEVHPQAVDYLNGNQENLFHVAIRSRNQKSIIKIVTENKLLKRNQLIAIDKDYNTIMHKVGYKPFVPGKDNEDVNTKGAGAKSEVTTEVLMDTEIKTPIHELSDELKLLEELEKLCPNYLVYYRNVDNLTARELFAKTNVGLREKAKEYLKQTAEHCTVVTILIATVAFAAAYTVPGGPDEHTGLPVLLGQPLFLVFTVTDVLSLGFGLTAVVIFLSILTSQFRMKDFKRTLPEKLLLGLTLLFLSVTMMMVSFAATIILTIDTKHDWTKIALYIVAFFPVIIFMMSYIPFYKELLQILSNCISRFGRKRHNKHVS